MITVYWKSLNETDWHVVGDFDTKAKIVSACKVLNRSGLSVKFEFNGKTHFNED